MNNATKSNTKATMAVARQNCNRSEQQEENEQEETTMNIIETLQTGTQAANATGKVFTGITEQMEQKASAFLKEHRSKAGSEKLNLIEGSIARGEIKLDEALAKLTEIQVTDTNETVSLMNAHTAAHKAQGDAGLKIGAGIGLSAAGLGFLGLILKQFIGKKAS